MHLDFVLLAEGEACAFQPPAGHVEVRELSTGSRSAADGLKSEAAFPRFLLAASLALSPGLGVEGLGHGRCAAGLGEGGFAVARSYSARAFTPSGVTR